MNQKKTTRNPIVSLAMLKGKPSTLSVPSIRFNPGEEDLEEIPVQELSNDDSTVLKPVVEFDINDIDNTKERRTTLTTSSSADATKEHSPVRDVLQKLNRRSSSLDSASSAESINNDGWSLFQDLKGKITTTLEEKWHIDFRSNGGNMTLEKPLNEDDRSSKMHFVGGEEGEKNLLDPEVAEEAVESSTQEVFRQNDPTSKLSPTNKSFLPQSSSEKSQTVSAELRQRRTKFLSKNEEPAMTMSLLATKSEDDDFFEEELHDEYVREIQHEDIDKDVKDSEIKMELQPTELKECDIINENKPLPVAELSTARKLHWERKHVIYMLLTLGYLVIPIPSYVSGFILGVVMSVVIMNFYYQLTRPVLPKQPVASPPFMSSLPNKASVIPNTNRIVYKGWMNLLLQPYDPLDYHVSQTHSVFIRLEGNMLRVSHPKAKIPKHASFKENLQETSFVVQKYYNLYGCKITNEPIGLAKKRLWSRKYPIRILLNETAYMSHHLDSIQHTQADGDNDSDIGPEQASNSQEDCLHLFTRSNRDKEEWYWRFKLATELKDDKIMETKSAPSSPKHSVSNQNEYVKSIISQSSLNNSGNLQSSSLNSGSVPDVSQLAQEGSLEKSYSEKDSTECLIDFDSYMKRLLPNLNVSMENIFFNSSPKEYSKTSPKKELNLVDSEISWLNAFVGRCFWDFLREDYWMKLVKMKIQKKLSKIKVPYFMEELVISDLQFGNQLPVIKGVSSPTMNDRGLWIDLDVTYSGVFKMTLETKLNLLKLKKEPEMKEMKDLAEIKEQRSRLAIFDSDEEDSAESSSDNEGGSEFTDSQNEESSSNLTSIPGRPGTSKKLLRIVDKITQSRYFQHATQYKYVRRAVQDVSNTRLILAIEVHSVHGIVSLNIPPPPTDRLWYGFKINPQVTLVAKPRLGEREVTVSSVTEWIEKKLIQEFQKIFVIPNMDDIIIPFMSSGIPPTQTTSAQASPNHTA